MQAIPKWTPGLLAAIVGLSFCCTTTLRAADNVAVGFDKDQDTTALTTTGDVTRDPGAGRTGGALRVGPGGRATLSLRPNDGAGRVEMWVRDDLAKPADPKARRVGPRWGLTQSDGQVVVVGVIYAPYLAGDTTYAVQAGDPKTPFAGVQYTGSKRSGEWQKWTFDFDADKGLTILVNDKKARFDWNVTSIKGFSGITLMGDDAKDAAVHTLLIDDVAATLGGAMKAQPLPPPPPPPVVPDQDPAVETPLQIVPALNGKHPRLLFSADDVPALKAKAASAGKPFMTQLEQYLGASVPPTDNKYVTDATDAQRQGLWRLPTVALNYVLTGKRESLDRGVGFLKAFVAQPHWETGEELDSGMAAANVMVGAALAYDWLYNDLDPDFREQVRAKLLLQARRMYYGGHLMKVGKTHYWQQDPHNNHRWHRNAGLTLCALAVADDKRTDDDWIVARAIEDLQFVHKWLPEDGSSHESPSYLVFGGAHLVLAFQAADRCLGLDLLGHRFFKETPVFRIAMLAPGLHDAFGFGDSGGFGHYNNYNFAATARHKLANEQAALLNLFQQESSAFEYGWMSLVWFDPTIGAGDPGKAPRRVAFDDVGVAVLRDGWQANDVAMMLKSGPYGGKTLNAYRNENGGKYINVAHDDPDANMFVLWGRGAWLAANDGYAKKKLSSSHNTILVNGKGQKGEGTGWTQPLKGADADMTRMAGLTVWQDGGDDGVSIVEGEAAGAYARMDAYRRTVAWVPGKYVLLLDSIVPQGSAEITWLMQAPEVVITDAPTGRFRLKNGKAESTLVVASSHPLEATVADSTAESRGTPLGLRQLQLKAACDTLRVAAAFDPWSQRELKVSLTAHADHVEVRVGDDVWTWTPADTRDAKTVLSAKLSGGQTVELKK